MPGFAQSGGRTQFRIEADQTQVAVGEPVTITLAIENLGRNADASPTTPDFGELQVQAGPSQQTAVSIVNGISSINRYFKWQVAAPREGSFTIGPSTLTSDGRNYSTDPLTITAVTKVSNALPGSLGKANIIPARTGDREVNKALEGRLFLLPEVSDSQPYVSQPVIVSYKLLRDPRLNIGNFNEQTPDIQGALSEEIFHAKSIQWQRTQIDGRSFDVAPMLIQAIIPTKAGRLSLDGYAMGGSLVLPRQNRRSLIDDDPFRTMQQMMDDPFFSDPFFNRGMQVQLLTPPIELQVRPLPEAAKPASFSGAVGEYTIAAATDRSQAGEDDLIAVTVTLDGRGAVELATPPTLADDSFEVVGSSSTVEKTKSVDGIGGKKHFELVLRARRPGRLTVPAIEYATFNPWKEQYETLRTLPISLTITPGAQPRGGVRNKSTAAVSNAAGDLADLYYLKPLTGLRTGHPRPLLSNPWLWAAQAAALAVCIAAWRRRRLLLRRDPAQERRQGAWRRFERRIRTIQHQAAGDGSRQIAAQLEGAARDCIADFFNLSADGLTRREIEQLLRDQAISAERVERICNLLDDCATLRYAPEGSNSSDLRRWSAEMTSLLKEGLAR